MKKSFYGFLGFSLVLALMVISNAGTAQAGLNVNINFGPPQIVEAAPPEIVMMPGMGVYYVPSASFDIFFFNGYWWSRRGDGWYRSNRYNAGWAKSNNVPRNLMNVPKNYRDVYKKEKPINYGQWKNHGQNDQGRGEQKGNKGNHGGHGRGK